jgi:hypothetical protein
MGHYFVWKLSHLLLILFLVTADSLAYAVIPVCSESGSALFSSVCCTNECDVGQSTNAYTSLVGIVKGRENLNNLG